jgi:hypothetical protein
MTEQPVPGRLRRFLELPFHPFLLSAYAVLFLWSRNVGKVRTADVVQPFAYVIGATAVLLAIGWLAFRSAWRAAIVVSVWSFLFFSFGHVAGTVRSAAQADVPPPSNEGIWLAVWAVIAVGVVVAVALAKPKGRGLAFALNVIVGAMVAFALIGIGAQKVEARREASRAATFAAPAGAAAAKPKGTTTPVAATANGVKRDVFYLVIEEYPNEQTLKEEYGFDNRPFLDALRKRGFYIPERMRGPYPKTPHAVSSTVNMNYLSFPKTSDNWQIVYDSLRHSKVAQEFQKLGYKYILIGSGFHAIRKDDTADVNLIYDPKAGPVTSEFGQVLYDSTVLAALASRYHVGTLDERYKRYQEVMYMYQRSMDIPRDPAPTFSFLHIETTHSPYVIDRNGHFMSESRAEKMTSHEAYLESLRYSNKRALELIDRIQGSYPSDRQPIIVYQADEGPGPVGWNPNTEEHYDWTRASQNVLDVKFRIFSSYYLPGLKDTGLYPTISTTNSFRLIFDKYFGRHYALLPDRSYVFRDEQHPYEFIDVTGRVSH